MKDANPVILHELKLEAQKIVDLRLRADPCSRSYVAKLEADEAALLQNFSKKVNFSLDSRAGKCYTIYGESARIIQNGNFIPLIRPDSRTEFFGKEIYG